MISAPGIGSGLDVNGIVSQLMSLERRPLNLLDARTTQVRAQISAYGQLRSQLSSFQSSLAKLAGVDKFTLFSAQSSKPEVLTASASPEAGAGSYQIEVLRIAEHHRLAANAVFADSDTTVLGEPGDSLTLTVGEVSFDVASGGKTLEQIRDAINQAPDNAGVTASIIKDDAGFRLTLRSSVTGSGGAVQAAYSGADPFDFQTLNADRDGSGGFSAADLDAELLLEGAFTVTSSSNSLTGVIPEVTLSIKEAGTTTLTVSRDLAAVRKNVQDFVAAYNQLVQSLKGLREGQLKAEGSALLNMRSQLQAALAAPGPEGGAFRFLAELGVRTTESGTLEIDQPALDRALENDLPAVAALFGDPQAGAVARLKATADRYLAGDGVIASRTESLNSRLRSMAVQREQLEFRLGRVEERLLRQFQSLDALISGLTATSDFLAQQLAALPGPRRES